jgi:hypothetical protein
MNVVILNAEDEEGFTQQLAMARAELRNTDTWYPNVMNENLGLVIQGHSLAHVLNAVQNKPVPTKQRFSLGSLFGAWPQMPAQLLALRPLAWELTGCVCACVGVCFSTRCLLQAWRRKCLLEK